jgi:hypothetical protein
MATFKISNAEDTYVEFNAPSAILHVVTRLPSAWENPGYCPIAKRALMKDIQAKTTAQGFSGYQIHWSDQDNNLGDRRGEI